MQLTRRALLMAAAGLVLAGCRPRSSRTPALSLADRTAIEDALDAEQELLAAYDAAVARLDAVAATPLARARDRHAVHVAALASASRSPARPTSSPATDAPDLLRLRVALQEGAGTLRTAAVAASDGKTAALLASIAAEHAADAETGSGTR